MGGADEGGVEAPPHPGVSAGRVIWNRGAGQKAGLPTNGGTEDEFRAVVERLGLTPGLVEVGEGDDVTLKAREALAAGASPIVAAGGDGTVDLVAEALLGSEVPLGILPLGSVMNIARMLHIPRDLEGAADVIAAGHTCRIDVGLANGEVRFYEAGSVGLSAAVFEHVQRAADGEPRGLREAAAAAFRYRPARMDLELDGRLFRTAALTVFVANGPYSGMGFTVAPDARLDDGRFDIAVFRHFSKLDLVRHFASIALGRRRYSPHVTRLKAASVRVSSRRPLPTRADGNDLGTTPITFETLPAALLVLAPEASSEERA
jgi:diacylglycerol kinase (ATP)